MIAALFPIIGEVIKRVLPNKDKQVEAQSKLNSMMLDGSFKEFEKQADIIIAEAQSEHKLTAQWRPITMLVFVIIIANNYLVYPYLSLFWIEAPLLELPPDLWQLLKIGLGGYVVGRSGEKIAKVIKGQI